MFKDPYSLFQKNQFIIIISLSHLIFIILFVIFGRYSANALPTFPTNNDSTVEYPMFMDIHGMIFVGFGMLMVFLKKYSYSSVSINMLLASFSIEWSIIIRGFLSTQFQKDGTFEIGILSIIDADFSAAVVLISMGALLGKLTPTQYLILTIIEVPASVVTEYIVMEIFHVNDVGGSMTIHIFGCFFGLAAAKAFYVEDHSNSANEGSSYNSDVFGMVGTIFLFIYWPSFNAATAVSESAKQRCIMNTYLSLTASAIATFITSQIVDKNRKFDMVHICNSTLAGGVAIGTVGAVILNPWISLVIGSVGGVVSVLGYKYSSPFLKSKLGIHDTCGVANLHGFPALISGVCSIILAGAYPKADYGSEYTDIYPATSPTHGHSHFSQPLYQLFGILLELAASIVIGLLTGYLLKLKIWNQLPPKDLFSDQLFFHTPDDFNSSQYIQNLQQIEVCTKNVNA
uniref:Ammonium_transp domain-containing protein n=1 Tax=Rhabditophanes sp. KR3021 TaxID=114890 RepID=A0AC35UDF4_9BILA